MAMLLLLATACTSPGDFADECPCDEMCTEYRCWVFDEYEMGEHGPSGPDVYDWCMSRCESTDTGGMSWEACEVRIGEYEPGRCTDG